MRPTVHQGHKTKSVDLDLSDDLEHNFGEMQHVQGKLIWMSKTSNGHHLSILTMGFPKPSILPIDGHLVNYQEVTSFAAKVVWMGSALPKSALVIPDKVTHVVFDQLQVGVTILPQDPRTWP